MSPTFNFTHLPSLHFPQTYLVRFFVVFSYMGPNKKLISGGTAAAGGSTAAPGSTPCRREEVRTVIHVNELEQLIKALEGISPFDHWQKLSSLPTQNKPYNPPPPRDSRSAG